MQTPIIRPQIKTFIPPASQTNPSVWDGLDAIEPITINELQVWLLCKRSQHPVCYAIKEYMFQVHIWTGINPNQMYPFTPNTPIYHRVETPNSNVNNNDNNNNTNNQISSALINESRAIIEQKPILSGRGSSAKRLC